MRYYATYFDRHYLARGLALYRSLERHSAPFVLWVLCLDGEVERMLTALGLEDVRLVPLAQLERTDPALLTVKPERLPVEYYWTCGPAFLLHVFQRDPGLQMLTYLDADLFFFSDPSPVFEELGSNSIMIVESRRTISFPEIETHLGRYNVGLIVFRATASGLACLRRWREQCLEWCFDRIEEGRFGDQAYLDEWAGRFEGVAVLKHRGGGVAPANILDVRTAYERGRVTIEGAALIFYHFSQLRRISRWYYEMHAWRFHRQGVNWVVRQHIYGRHVRELQAAEAAIRRVGGRIHPCAVGSSATAGSLVRRVAKGSTWRTAFVRHRRFILVVGPFSW